MCDSTCACMLTWLHAFPPVTVSRLSLFFRLKCVDLQKVGRRLFLHLHIWFLLLQHLWFDFDSFWNFPLVMETFIRSSFDCWGPRAGHSYSVLKHFRSWEELLQADRERQFEEDSGILYFKIPFYHFSWKKMKEVLKERENNPNKTELNTIPLSYLWWMIMIRQALKDSAHLPWYIQQCQNLNLSS